MTEYECIPFRQTGYFSKLICDYLDQQPFLEDFYQRFPSLENAEGQMQDKAAHYSNTYRSTLHQVLKAQYTALNLGKEHPVNANIDRLREEQTFTVVTGHQLNILTGPLYFIYKITSTIALCRQLKERYPQQNFIPVFWMASEDHDFEEISFVNLPDRRIQWAHDWKGAVGTMPLNGMGKVLDELEKSLGSTGHAQELLRLFREAYQGSDSMAEATRRIVHGLFGQEGLVILDGNEPELKNLVREAFWEDLTQHSLEEKINVSTEKLAAHYHKQAHSRQINLFYLRPGRRDRIERQGETWSLDDGSLQFTRQEIRKELEDYPERFSPNAVFRPVYQEMILPNLAYIGGGGEIAYWLQLKEAFDHWKIPLPMLSLRDSFLWVSPKWKHRLQDLQLKPRDLFSSKEQLKAGYIRRNASMDTDLKEYHQELEQMFASLEDLAQLTEESMLGAVNAQRQKQMRGLEKLRKKLLRAEKRRQKTVMDKIDRIHGALFPEGGLQERHDTLAPYYAQYGPAFIQTLLEQADPLQDCFGILGEDVLVEEPSTSLL